MLTEILSVLAFAALFMGFAWLRPMDGRGGCHGCTGSNGGEGCRASCARDIDPIPARNHEQE
jgi:hypothetical protein